MLVRLNGFINKIACKKYVGTYLALVFLFSLLAYDVFIIKPHYDGNGYLWNLIIGASDSYTKDYNGFNDLNFFESLFEFAHQLSPEIPWLPVVLLIINFLSVAAIIISIIILGRIHQLPYVYLISAVLFLTALLNSNLLWIHHNRTGFLMSLSALVVASSLSIIELKPKAKGLFYLMVFIWFTGGACLRPEAAFSTLVMLLPGVVFLFKSAKKKELIRIYCACGLVIMIFMSYYLYQIVYSSSFYYQMEPEVEYEIMDRKNIVPLADMETKQDSARYKAVTSWMLGDINQTTPGFMRTIINKSPDNFSRLFFLFNTAETGQTPLLFEKVIQLARFNKSIFLFFFICLMLSIVYHRLMMSVGMIFHLVTGIIVLSAGLSINTVARVSEPLLCIICTWAILLLVYEKRNIASITGFGLIILALIYFCQNIYEAKAVSSTLTLEEQQRKLAVNRIINESKRKYVLLAGDWSIVNTGIFNAFTGFKGKQLLLTEAGQFSANRSFLETIAQITGCKGDDYLCRMKFINENKSDIIIIGRPKRIALYDYYMKSVYDYDLDFELAPSQKLYDEIYFWLP